MRDPYARLAPVYDSMANLPGIREFYRRWRHSLLDAAARYGVSGRTLVDIACGTGNSAIPWARRGWNVIGVDRSAAMLREARRKSRAVRWVRQELSELNVGVEADFVTCHFDALNHVLDARELERVFGRVSATLREGGLFQFDVNTRPFLRWVAAREKVFRCGPHWCGASHTFDEKSGVATFNQVWFVRRGNTYERRLVTVRERAFADSVLRAMLRRAGFRLRSVEPQVTIDHQVMRMLYIAQKHRKRDPEPRGALRLLSREPRAAKFEP